MGADGTKSNLLGLTIDLVKKTFMSKRTIIGVIVLNSAICLCHDFFESLDSLSHFVHGVVPHEMDVDEVAHMIAKCCTSPNVVTREEARHLGDESGLGIHDLIDGYTVARKYMLRVADRP